MINVTLKNVSVAFNQKAILTPAEKATDKILGQFGAYCRAVTRSSIKHARGPHHHAEKGKPPLYHDGPVNYKNTIFFFKDARKKTVYIGGVLLSNTHSKGDPVPGVLEHDGAKMGVKPKRIQRQGVTHGANKAVDPHPHTRPAFDKAVKKKLPDLIRGGIMREAR